MAAKLVTPTDLTDPEVRRFRVMLALLVWEGELSNARLRLIFGLQVVQVSRLIGAFRKAYPGTLAGGDVRPVRYRLAKLPKNVEVPTLDDYLAIARIYPQPEIEDARQLIPDPNPDLFALMRKACLHGHVVTLRYASMREPAGTQRGIVPTRLVRFGRRWHARAWCLMRQDYRDFNLGRIIEVLGVEDKHLALPADTLWHKKLKVSLAPHRMLLPQQQALVSREFCGGKAYRSLAIRAALLSYTLREIGVATDPASQRPPKFQLELLEPEALVRYRFPED